MKLADARKAHEDFSGKASDISRQLAFAGIALIWIFKSNSVGGGISVPAELIPAAFALVIGLAIDLLQYVYGGFAWGQFHRIKEKELNRNQDKTFGAPRWINWPTEAFWWLKIAGVAIGYFFILRYLWIRLAL